MADQLISGTTLIEDKRTGTGVIWSASGIDFIAGNSGNTVDWEGTNDGDLVAGSSMGAQCPVHLPNGVTVTKAVVFGSATADTWVLHRKPIEGGASTSMATANVDTEDTSISNDIINNDTFAYFFIVLTLASSDLIHGARIVFK